MYDMNKGSGENSSVPPNGSANHHSNHERRRRSASQDSAEQSRRHPRGVGNNSHRSAAADRFYDECEYERRVRKRRVRLLTATEEAFSHIRHMGLERSKSFFY